MNRSKFSTKALMLVGALALPVATLGTAQPAAAQETCPIGTFYDFGYGCSSAGYPYYDYFPYGHRFYGHHDFDHGFHGGFHGGGFHVGMAGGFHGGGGHR
jgi:hypothetical protein